MTITNCTIYIVYIYINKQEVHKRYIKPYRKCIFCKTMSSKLSRHLVKAHKHEPRVKAIVEMSVGKRLVKFGKIRREGIILFNKKEAGKEHPGRTKAKEIL